MNRIAIFEEFPNERWNALSAAERKAWAVRLINGALTEIRNSGLEPDKWESYCLANAVNCLATGMFATASKEVEYAAAPATDRSQVFVAKTPKMSLDALYRALIQASKGADRYCD